jgi:hypothetical protein
MCFKTMLNACSGGSSSVSGAGSDEPGKRQKYAIRPKPNLASKYLQAQESAAAAADPGVASAAPAAAAGSGLDEEASKATSLGAMSQDAGQQVSSHGHTPW